MGATESLWAWGSRTSPSIPRLTTLASSSSARKALPDRSAPDEVRRGVLRKALHTARPTARGLRRYSSETCVRKDQPPRGVAGAQWLARRAARLHIDRHIGQWSGG